MRTFKQEKATTSRPRKFLWLAVACLMILFSVTACGEDVFADTNQSFFLHVLNRLERDEVKIYTVDAYKLENRYYYCVDYAYVSPVTEEWTRIELVYFGTNGIDSYFNPNWENFGDMQKQYDRYLEAVVEGEHKSFTKEEIAEQVDSFYQTK